MDDRHTMPDRRVLEDASGGSAQESCKPAAAVTVRKDGVVAVDFAVPPPPAIAYRIWKLFARVAVTATDEYGGPAVFPFCDGLIGVTPDERTARALARRILRVVRAA